MICGHCGKECPDAKPHTREKKWCSSGCKKLASKMRRVAARAPSYLREREHRNARRRLMREQALLDGRCHVCCGDNDRKVLGMLTCTNCSNRPNEQRGNTL